MIIWGISALSHDASVTVIINNKIVFGAHAERFTRIKNDKNLNQELIDEALKFGTPDKIVWYENPCLKNLRLLMTGEFVHTGFSRPQKYIRQFLPNAKLTYSTHHKSHIAAAFYTSGFENAIGVCVDAIGEFDTISIWDCSGTQLKKLKSVKYPSSLGLFYSAITQYVGLKPNEEEYILMGMAAYGDKHRFFSKLIDLCYDPDTGKPIINFHKGFRDISFVNVENPQDVYDLAAAAQLIVELKLMQVFNEALDLCMHKNIVFCGGVALNCVANSKLVSMLDFENFWILPNPGDSGSSLGAALSAINNQVEFKNAYLGHNVVNSLDHAAILDELIHRQKNMRCR